MVVVLVDALGWDAVQEVPPEPWLGELLPERRPLDTVLGFSSGAIPALLSGTWPAENGRWLMYARASGSTPLSVAAPFARLPRRLRGSFRVSRVLHRLVARQVKGYFALYDVPWRLLPLFDLAERRFPYQPGGLDGRPTWFDRWAERGYRVRGWDWRTPESDNADGFVREAGSRAADAADVLFWYTPGQDERQHRLGTHAPAVRAHLDWLGDRIARAAQAAASAGREAWIYVLSDHGMTDVTRQVDVMGAVERARAQAAPGASFQEGRDWLAFYDSTLARFWWLSEEARRDLRPAVREALQALDAGRWLGPEEERQLGIHFEDRRYGEDLFLVEPGALIVPSYMGRRAVRGMHGYHPSEPTSRAVFLSNRPLPRELAHVVDVAKHLESECDERESCPARC